MLKVEKISIERLQPNDYNPNEMTESEFTEFVAEVGQLGRLPKPVVVRPGADGEFTIIDGEHAWKAAKEAGLAEISCEVMDADDFEAMRQTYKRNQHGTHNKVLLAKMFKRMGQERGLSLRELAKETEVSEGTIRNTIEYLKAVKVRNGYVPDDDSEAAIADLTIKQVRLFNRLPVTLGNIWLDSGADMKTFIGKAKDLKTYIRDYPPAASGLINDRWKYVCEMSEAEYLDYSYGGYESLGLLQYLNPVRNTGQFTSALNQIKEWKRWEDEYFCRFSDAEWYTREEFRKYARYYYEGIWPFGRDVRWMKYALNMIIKKEDERVYFRITPDEFDAVIEQVTEYCQSERTGLSVDMFQDYFNLAIYEKTGEKVEAQKSIGIREQFMQAEIEREAPGYIRESKLRSVISKYALWQVMRELENNEDKVYIEQIAHKLAEKEFVPRDKSCVMAKSERKFELSLGKDVKLQEEKWAVWSYINKLLVVLKADIHRDTAGNIELAMEVTDFVYKKDDAPEAHKKMSVILSQLQEGELKRLHREITYCQMVRMMRSI